MGFSDKKVEFDIIPRLTKKAAQSKCAFFIAAAAFTKKGNLLGVVSNSHNIGFLGYRRGQSQHAEAKLIKRFGNKIDTIYLIRIGRDLSRLPIHPCETCQRLIDRLNIRVIPIHIDYGYKPTNIYP